MTKDQFENILNNLRKMKSILILIKRIPSGLSFLLSIFFINFLIFALLRIAFFSYFRPANQPFLSKTILKAFYIGFKFDARLSALIILPALLFSWLPHLNLTKTKLGRKFWILYFAISIGIITFIYSVDFGVYSYVQSRVNATLLNELENLDISIKMVLQTYPVAIVIPLIIVGSLLYSKLLKRIFTIFEKSFSSTKFIAIFSYIFSSVLIVIVIYGRLSQFPLRWSDAFFTTDNFINGLALNPVLYLYATLSNNPVEYDIEEVKKYYPVITENHGVKPDFENLSIRRFCNPNPKISGNPNIVFIILETFAGFKVGALGNRMNPSPNFDRLAKDGILFTRFYTPMENTSRSIFSWLTGIPDVTEKRYASWHPEIVDQHTILNYFEGYKKLFFIGGSASWGNIRGVLSSNIKELRIFEEGFFRSPRLDVWGISDADLFMETNEVLRKTESPFFAIILTSGNHRPFKIPENSRGFVSVNIDEKILKENGFYSLKEYNGFRFLDHCLGYYFSLAEKEEYFKNTIFVIFGDHGTSGGSSDNRFGDLSFGPFHIPFLIYSPSLIKEGKRIDSVASSIDILPTVASLVGKPYLNKTLGRDLFDQNIKNRFAFTFTPFRIPPRVGLIQNNFYVNVEPDGSYSLYDCEVRDPVDLKKQYPEKAKKMAELAKAIHEYSKYLLYHNKKEK